MRGSIETIAAFHTFLSCSDSTDSFTWRSAISCVFVSSVVVTLKPPRVTADSSPPRICASWLRTWKTKCGAVIVVTCGPATFSVSASAASRWDAVIAPKSTIWSST